MPAKLCKRHRCCKWPRKLKMPDTSRYRERQPRGGDTHTSPDVKAAAHCMRSSSCKSHMWCDKGKAAWWQIVPFKLQGGSKKAESTTTVTLPRLASDIYPQRGEISAVGWLAASGRAQQRNKASALGKRYEAWATQWLHQPLGTSCSSGAVQNQGEGK